MRRVFATLVAALVACIGLAQPDDAVATPAPHFLCQSYEGHHHSTPLTDSTSERGPPTAYDHDTSSGAADLRSRGASALPATGTTRPVITYDHLALLVVQGAGVVTTPLEVTRDSSGLPSSFQRSDVAAKTRKLDNVDGLPCNCFVAGTKVQTNNGETPIEDIKVGDRVWAKDLDTGESHLRTVTGLFQKHADQVMSITVADGAKVTVTDEHPFYVTGEGWVMSGDLRVGDRLAQRDGTSTTIRSIEVAPADTTVYNFTVEGDHNYYVTEAQLLVHNCSYVDLTKPGSIRNVGTDISHTDFANNLGAAGWASRSSKDGSVLILERGGAKYTLRSKADSYAGWTAEFFPAGSSSATLKIRLGYTP